MSFQTGVSVEGLQEVLSLLDAAATLETLEMQQGEVGMSFLDEACLSDASSAMNGSQSRPRWIPCKIL